MLQQTPLQPAPVSNAFTAQCIGVGDGDTITVLYNNQPNKVRLYGVDAHWVRNHVRYAGRQIGSLMKKGWEQ
jgi:endonuclease YncB( thermonuclease family)